MKKALSVMLAFIFLLVALSSALPAYAASGDEYRISFSLTDAEAVPGEEAVVNIDITENTGFYAFYVVLCYDSDAMTLESFEGCPELLAFGDFEPTQNDKTVDTILGPLKADIIAAVKDSGIAQEKLKFKILFFESTSVTEDTLYTGNAGTARFRIKDDAYNGAYTISALPIEGNVIDCESNALSSSPAYAAVNVSGGEEDPGPGVIDFFITNSECNTGESAAVELGIGKNDGIFGFFYMLYYSKDLTITDFSPSESLKKLGVIEESKNNAVESDYEGTLAAKFVKKLSDSGIDTSKYYYKMIYFESFSLTENVTYTGKIADITFTASADAEAGDFGVIFVDRPGNVINCKGEELAYTFTDGIIKVVEAEVTEPPATDAPGETSDPAETDASSEAPGNVPGGVTETTDLTETETADKPEKTIGSEDGSDTVSPANPQSNGTPSNNPSTGDNILTLFIIALSALCMISISLFAFVLFRKPKKEQS